MAYQYTNQQQVRADIRQRLKEYRENEGGAYRVIKRRVKRQTGRVTP